MRTREDWQTAASNNRVLATGEGESLDNCQEAALDFIGKCSQEDVNSKADKHDRVVQYIDRYISEKHPTVVGFILDSGEMDYGRLRSTLLEYILDYKFLTPYMHDPSVYEIRVYDLAGIHYEKGGRSYVAKDPQTDAPLRFSSVNEMMALAGKLLSTSNVTVGWTRETSIRRGSSYEGFRVSVIGPAAISPAANAGDKVTQAPAIVIRKFPDKVFTVEDLLRFGTFSTQMINLQRICVRIGFSMLVAGVTGSGKTGTLNTWLDAIPNDRPTATLEYMAGELKGRKYSKDGLLLNEILQALTFPYSTNNPNEVAPEGFASRDAVFTQLQTMSTKTLILGEAKEDYDFLLAQKAMNAGQQFMASLHAYGTERAIERGVEAVQACTSNMQRSDILSELCANIDFIVHQDLMDDGVRRQLELAEVVGVKVDNTGRLRADLNPLFRFEPDGKGFDNNQKLHGEYLQIGSIKSEKHLLRLKYSGIASQFSNILKNDASPEHPIVGDSDRGHLIIW